MNVFLKSMSVILLFSWGVYGGNESMAEEMKSAVLTYEKVDAAGMSLVGEEVVHAYYTDKTIIDTPNSSTCIDFALQQVRIEQKDNGEVSWYRLESLNADVSQNPPKDDDELFQERLRNIIATPEIQADGSIRTPLRGYSVNRLMVIWGQEIMLLRKGGISGIAFLDRYLSPGIEEYLVTTDLKQLEDLLLLLKDRESTFRQYPLLKRVDPGGMITLLQGVPVKISTPEEEVFVLKNVEFNVGKKQDFLFQGACR